MRSFRAFAPSNIALVKYMGKLDPERNLPANPSISMTLSALRTHAELEELPAASASEWRAELPAGAGASAKVPTLKPAGAQRVLGHLERIRAELPALLAPFASLGLGARLDQPFFALKSANTFPAASGIASSASSFAAVTLAGAQALCSDPDAFAREWKSRPELRRALARLARQGSGSACRSFEGPFVLWEGESAAPIPSALPALSHFAVVIASTEKSVSSSEAHHRVRTSPLWNGRPERAAARVSELSRAIAQGDLSSVSRIAWQEMWEMHSLFHTSEESFSYFAPGTTEVLAWLAPQLADSANPFVATLDAGPNVHLIVESRNREEWYARLRERFPLFEILQDSPGLGAELV